MKRINQTLLDATSQQAQQATRKRKNHNFHEQMDDPMHRMLNALEMGTYIRPHKHENPDKREAFLVLRGKLAVLIFDDLGNVADREILNPSTGNYGVEIAPGVWHTLICLAPNTVIYEIKDGPWNIATDKDFADWAPAEGSAEVADYQEKLMQHV